MPKAAIRTHDYDTFADRFAQRNFNETAYVIFRDLPQFLCEYAKGPLALDYGCGAGRSTRFLQSLGFRATGVDINCKMLEYARKLDPAGTYHQIKSGSLPFDNDSFHFIFSAFVFLEIASLDEMYTVVQEMSRVMIPGGTIVIITATTDYYRGDWVTYDTNFPENQRPLNSGDTVKVLIREQQFYLYDYFWTEADYKGVFTRAGLNVVDQLTALGTANDPIAWKDETTKSAHVAFVLQKA